MRSAPSPTTTSSRWPLGCPTRPRVDLARSLEPRRGARGRPAPGRGGGCRRSGGPAPRRISSGVSKTVRRAVEGAARPTRAGARVARPALHRRALGARDDRDRRRRGRPRGGGPKSRTAEWDEIAAVAARRGGGDALRLECAAGSLGGRGPRRARWRRSARSASGPSTPRRRSPGPGPAWSREPSCSPTCFTRIGLTPRRGGRSKRCRRRAGRERS